MAAVDLKSNLHKIIDETNNENLLSKFLELISKMSETKNGELWNRLTKSEQEELLNIELESRNEENLIPHSEMKKKYSKWL